MSPGASAKPQLRRFGW